jgi:hypothetical protein
MVRTQNRQNVLQNLSHSFQNVGSPGHEGRVNGPSWREGLPTPHENFEYFDAKSCILSYIFADLDQFNFDIGFFVVYWIASY